MNYKLIIEKQKELIKKLNRFTEYQHDSIVNGEDADYEEVFDHRLGKIKQLESELAALEAEPEAKEQNKKPSDLDIENAAADYINEPEQTWNTADYLHIADAYEQGAKDMRDNNIYISPK
jgi:hypothetical protein